MGTSLGNQIVQRPIKAQNRICLGSGHEERLRGCGDSEAKAALQSDDVVQINEYRDLQRLKTRKFGAFHLENALIAKEKPN